MSGLAVLVSRDGRPAEPGKVLAMLDAIPYRGPDGAFARQVGRVVLGHASMVTTASERGVRQPLVSRRSGCWIVADLRLDNRDAVCAQLASAIARDASDAELVLAAYDTWGIDAAAHLVGDFAFVIWDPRNQRLMCARDASGQRSLFFRTDGRTLAVASEIHQLLQDPAVAVAPDDERILDALVPVNLFQNDKEQTRTYYKGISSLVPGHVLVLDGDRLAVRRYRDVAPPAPIRYRTQAEYVDHFRDLFFQVVADRLRTTGPLGALLSGGLDSSSLVGAAHELYRSGRAVDSGFQTFSAVYPGLECDEQPLIEQVHARFGFTAHYLSPDPTREEAQLESSGFQASPGLTTAGKATLFDAAERAGARVLLTGEVADSILRGSPLVFDSLLRQGHWRSLALYLRAHRAATRDSLAKSLTLYTFGPLLPRALQKQLMASYAVRHLELERWRLFPTWIPGELREALFVRNRALVLGLETRRVFANESHHQLQLNLEPPEVPTIPSGWPIEIWRPFADRRLHEFLLAVPPEHLFEPVPDDPFWYGSSKQLLRRSMRGVLPESIRTRTRPTQFSATVGQELNRQWALHESVFGPAGDSEVARRGYVDQVGFWDRLQHLRAGQSGVDFPYIHFVIGLETWLRGLHGARRQVTTVATRAGAAPAVLVADESDDVLFASSPTAPSHERQLIHAVRERR